MRRAVVAGLGIVMAVSAAAPAAHAVTKVRYRTVRAAYKSPGGVTDVISGTTYVNGDEYGSAMIPTRRGETAIDLTFTDEAGKPVAADVKQDLDGDGTFETDLGSGICGGTRKALKLRRAGRPVGVFLLAGTCGSGASLPTRGTVVARLHTPTR